MPGAQKDNWCLYLLECNNGAYYAGITNNLEARFATHMSGKGARYTRANPPIKIMASTSYPDRSTASIAEAQLKSLPRHKKLRFFERNLLRSLDNSHE
ncbi:MAG: GIY-YIG nuclease family protein [Methylotenera sp.]|nr:GIY-YIG nuclease family protein [Methylotenera sp.]